MRTAANVGQVDNRLITCGGLAIRLLTDAVSIRTSLEVYFAFGVAVPTPQGADEVLQ